MKSTYKFLRTEEEAIQALDSRCDFKHVVFELFRDNLNVAKKALEVTEQNFVYLSQRLKDDEQILTGLFNCRKSTGFYLAHCSPSVKDNSKLFLMALQSLPSERMKDDLVHYHASDRIKELCKDRQPESALQADLLAKKLTEELAYKPTPRSTKIKI